MALPTLHGKRIRDTYQRVIQTFSGSILNGVGEPYTGSIQSLTAVGGFTGSLLGTASAVISSSHALVADTVAGDGRLAFITTSSLGQTQRISGSLTIDQNLLVKGTLTVESTASFTYVTSSVVVVDQNFIQLYTSGTLTTRGGVFVGDSGSFATGAFYYDTQLDTWYVEGGDMVIKSGSLTSNGMNVNGDMVVHGTVTAREFIVSSSVVNLTTQEISGSTKFGNSADDTHSITGSLSLSGSALFTGSVVVSGSLDVQKTGSIGYADITTANVSTFSASLARVSGSLTVTGSTNIQGNVVVDGTVTAREFIVSSSVTNIITQQLSGSTSFGNTADDTHIFTGSLSISGSTYLTGSSIISGNLDVQNTGSFGFINAPAGVINNLTASHAMTANAVVSNLYTREIHVSQGSGNDVTGTGKAGQPFASIQAALTASVAGDVVIIHPGVYGSSPADTIRILSGSITIKGASQNPEDVRINTNVFISQSVGDLFIEGVRIDNIVSSGTHNLTLQNVTVDGNATIASFGTASFVSCDLSRGNLHAQFVGVKFGTQYVIKDSHVGKMGVSSGTEYRVSNTTFDKGITINSGKLTLENSTVHPETSGSNAIYITNLSSAGLRLYNTRVVLADEKTPEKIFIGALADFYFQNAIFNREKSTIPSTKTVDAKFQTITVSKLKAREISGSLSITGSSSLTGSLGISGDVVVQGTVTAKEFIVSSSVVNITTQQLSGSTVFGNTQDDTHSFTGSLSVSGSTEFTGDLWVKGTVTAKEFIVSSSVTNIVTQQLSGSTKFGNSTDDTHIFTGSLSLTGSVTIDSSLIVTASHPSGSGAIQTDKLQFTGHSSADLAAGVGTLSWNQDELTLDLQQSGTTLQLGQEVQWPVINGTTSSIADGTAVMVTGTNGASGKLLVAPMVADGSVSSRYFLGLATQTIAAGATGKVTHFGKVRGINTLSYPTGSILWLDPANPGGLTPNEPQAPNLKIAAAYAVNARNNGTLAVRVDPGTRLSDAHDVQITSASVHDVLVYQVSGGIERWVNADRVNSASYALTASYINTLHQNVEMTGSFRLFGNLSVEGTASFSYLTASTAIIDRNYVRIYTSGSNVPKGGITVGDSGSLATGSFTYRPTASLWEIDGGDVRITSGALLATASNAVSASYSVTSSYAVTASYLNDLNQNLSMSGDLWIKGDITANRFIVSSSVTNLVTQELSGSTRFGDSIDDTHLFTGSFKTTGSAIVSGTLYITDVLKADYLANANYSDDAQAAAAGIPINGVYRTGNFLVVRLS